MKYRLFILFAITLICSKINAQQNPHFTQYMYNMSVINPAYTTSDTENINFGIIHRKQWTGFKGTETSALFAHKAVSDKIELGVSYTKDKFDSFLSNNFASIDIAYRIGMGNNNILSFGMKAGANFYDFDPTGVVLENSNDVAFVPINDTFLNLGAGVYFNTDNFYAGLSIPNFIRSEFSDFSNEAYRGRQEIHYYLTSGYVFELNNTFKLKPAFMAKHVQGAPLSLDLTANVLYNDRLEFGIGYRLDESISGLVNIRILPSLRIGYAYDYVTNDINLFTDASHEFILLYDLGLLSKKGYKKSPRFF